MALWYLYGFSFHSRNVRKMVQVTALQVHLVAYPSCLMGSHRTEMSVQEPCISQLLEELGLFI